MIEELTRLYDGYVDTFRAEDGRLPEMMRLKRTHTAFVVENAKLIADGEGFSPAARNHLAFRRDFLRRLSSDPAIDRVCALAKARLDEGHVPPEGAR